MLATLLEKRDVPAEPEEMRALFDRSGLDGEKLLARIAGEDDVPDLGPLSGLDREMGLSKREGQALAAAYVFEEDDAGEEERASSS